MAEISPLRGECALIIAKRFLCVLLLLSLISALCSCQENTENYPFETLDNGSGSIVPAYRIILPADCSSALYEKAEALGRLLAEQVGASVTVKFDYDTVLESEVPELLLGYTSRPLSGEYLSSLRSDDYLCRPDGLGGAVIGGKTDGATIAAIDRFCREILPAATGECLIPENGGFSFVGDYDESRVLLNGFELEHYRLVYPHGADERIRSLVERFRDRLAERCGYVLDICSDSEMEGMEKQIRLTESGDGVSSYLAHINPVSWGIEISAHGLFGFSVGLSELEAMLVLSEAEGEARYDIESAHSVPYEQDLYRIGSIGTGSGSSISTPSKLTDLISPLRDSLPDGVLLDGGNEILLSRIRDSLYPDYQRIFDQQGEALPALAKGEEITAVTVENTWGGGPTVAVYRAGSESYGFYLLRISGVLSQDGTVKLPQMLRDTKLPLVVLIHTEQAGGAVSLDSADFRGMRVLCNENYSVEGESYLFQCYVTDGALDVTVEGRESGSRYRELTVKRSSVYS